MSDLRRDRAYYLYRYGCAILRFLPRVMSRSVMKIVASVAYVTSPKTRTIVSKNLRPVVGDDLDDKQMRSLVKSAYVSYGQYWCDLARLENLIGTEFDHDFEAHNLERYLDLLKTGASVIALPHLGSWEIAGFWAHERGYEVHTVAEPSSSDKLTAWFDQQRSALGLRVYTLGSHTVAQLLHALDHGEVVALIADRDLVGDGVEVEFFGRKTRMPGGPALLALRSGRPLLPGAVYCDSKGRYLPFLLPPIPVVREGKLRDDVTRITQELAHAFEILIRRAPAQWHVFQPIWDDTAKVSET